MQKVIINVEDSAKFIAQLVREGVTFEARQLATHETDAPADSVEIIFTGGF